MANAQPTVGSTAGDGYSRSTRHAGTSLMKIAANIVTITQKVKKMRIDPSRVNILEKDIEDFLWENPNAIRGNGYVVERWLKRQYEVPSGIIDLLGVTSSKNLVVVEVKNVAINASALTQVSRYAFDILQIARGAAEYIIGDIEVRPWIYRIVVGKSMDDKIMLEAESIGVELLSFDVKLGIDIDSYSWSEHYEESRSAKHKSLQNDDDLLTVLQERSAYMRLCQEEFDRAVDDSIEIGQDDDTDGLIEEIEQELSEAD